MQRRRNIRKFLHKLSRLPHLEYTEGHLNMAHIHTYSMVLDENGEPTFEPCFFMPYKGELKAEPYDEQVDTSRWKWQYYKKGYMMGSGDWILETWRYFRDYYSA